MFGWLKKKEKVPFVRYKILPYEESGFIVERHTGRSTVETLMDDKKEMHFSSSIYAVVGNGNGNGIRIIKRKEFKTKEEAREFIDKTLSEENQRKAAYNDKMRRIEEHAKNNPPEWYP